MNKPSLISFQVKRFRSLMDVKINISDSSPVVICGENNIGKTNFLRAMNIFFNHLYEDDLFQPSLDIPFHIFDGSRGAGANTELTGSFLREGITETLKMTFKDGQTNYKLKGQDSTADDVFDYLSDFHYLFIESHNINLPILISAVLEKDGLLPLDAKRKKQSEPLRKLEEFIELSQQAISDIEKDINACFAGLTDFDGILKNKKIKIAFAEFEKLRDVVKTMTSITLFDGNTHGIASKGSGAQRALFLALMQYVSQHSKRNVIWGVDEPEAFLQPRLQRKVAEVLSGIVKHKKQPVILTTHSQHFVNLKDLTNTYIFRGTQTPRTYQRKPDRTYFETDTAPIPTSSDYEKATLIKQHLGISNNDGWEVLPYNILVEGEEDKKYLQVLFSALDIPAPNIIWAGGASKIAGYLQYYNHFSKDLPYKPEIVCIFDNDAEGVEQARKIKPNSTPYIRVSILPLPRHDGELPHPSNKSEWEIEDFLPPDQLLEVINQVLQKERYRKLSKKQIQDRCKPAHIVKGILKYAEECCSQNNPGKAPLLIDNEGRKKQICQKFCEMGSATFNSSLLLPHQIAFIRNLAK